MPDPDEAPKPKFSKGDTVRRVSRTADIGVIIGDPRCVNGQYFYRVNFGGRLENLYEDDLELCLMSEDPRELFLHGSFGDAESCQLFLTWLRVSGGLSNYVYSFYNSRTKFYPHQFKPLVKFLDNGRILLADEVGLGKTIEAGFIFVEMIARKELTRALIVCPAKLRNKWRREMLERFDLDFTIMNTRQFTAILREIAHRVRNDMQVIVSYESLHFERVLDTISELSVELDVVVADEAHTFRNSDTNTYAIATLLADRAAKLLFLTATPINNSPEDLFNILRLLDPHRFSDYPFFELMRQVNRNIVELEGLVRRGDHAPREQMGKLLNEIETGPLATVFKGFHFFEKVKDVVASTDSRSPVDWVDVQRSVSKLNLLGGHIVRTRRADVEEKRPVRTARTVRKNPAPLEAALYKETFSVLMRHYDEFRLPVMNVERILASCIPAFIEQYQAVCGAEGANYDWDDDDGEREQAQDDFLPTFAGAIQPILDNYGTKILKNGIDTKLTELLAALRGLDGEQPNCKVIIFSYFRRTIEYLSRKLAGKGYQNVFIHGGVPTNPEIPDEDEREVRRKRFQFDPQVRIMLSSEVGSEGLDFQFAHIVVNYDLPWNPMRVEQRIGRVDRIGQQAERILIYSLLLRDTVDDVIYEKLLGKIGVFRESLGDLEDILGLEIERVRDAVFDPKLSALERKAQLEQATEVIQKRMAEIRELDKDTAKILGADQYIKDEIERIRSSRRYVGPDEIQRLVHCVFESAPLNMNIEDEDQPLYAARVGATVRDYFDQWMDRSREANLFRGVLERKHFRWTFDYDVAASQPAVQLLNARHPAVRAICRRLEQDSSRLKPTFRVRCRPGDDKGSIPKGVFVLGVLTVEYQGAFPRKELATLGWDVQKRACVDETLAGAMLGRLLQDAEDLPDLSLDQTLMERSVAELESRALALFERKRLELEAEDNALLSQRKEQIQARAQREIRSHEQRRQTLEERLRSGNLDRRSAQNFRNLLRGVDINIQRVQERADSKLNHLEDRVKVTTSWLLRSLGIVRVE